MFQFWVFAELGGRPFQHEATIIEDISALRHVQGVQDELDRVSQNAISTPAVPRSGSAARSSATINNRNAAFTRKSYPSWRSMPTKARQPAPTQCAMHAGIAAGPRAATAFLMQLA